MQGFRAAFYAFAAVFERWRYFTSTLLNKNKKLRIIRVYFSKPRYKGITDMTLTKAELADMLVDKASSISKSDAKEIVEMFFEEIRATLERGEEVKISGFGNFQLRDKPQRPGRNPKTGEEVPITARRVVTFHASQKLKAMVENLYENKHDSKQR